MTTTFFLSGCLSLKFMMKRARVVRKIENDEMAMAGLVEKRNKAMMIGMATPPPPTPAILLNAIIKAKTKMPAISRGSTGKTFLWPQKPSSLTPQIKNG